MHVWHVAVNGSDQSLSGNKALCEWLKASGLYYIIKQMYGFTVSPLYGRTEAYRRVLGVAFTETGLYKAAADFFEGNTASEAVLKKCGMTKIS